MSTSTTRTSLPPDLSLEVFTNRGTMTNIAEYLPLTDQVALAKTCKAIHQIMTGKVIGPAAAPSATAISPEINTGIITTQMREQMATDGHRTRAPEYLQWQDGRAVLDPKTSPPVYPPIKNLDLSHTDVNDDECAQILQHCSPTALNLARCVHLTDTGLSRIFSNEESFCNLEHLDLTLNFLDEPLLSQIFRVCPKLKSLNLRWCTNLTSEGLSFIFSNAEWVQKLEHLDLSCTSAFSNDDLLEIIAKSCPNLKSLNCDSAGLTYHGLTQAFSTPCKWEHLEIGSRQVIFDYPLLKLIINNCPNLKSLGISLYNDQLTHDQLEDVFSSFKHPEKLESLNLDFLHSDNLNDAFLAWALRNFPSLKRLSLSSSESNFTPTGVRGILSSYGSLPHLEELSSCPLDIDDELLELIIRKCPNLTSLRLPTRTLLTYEGLSQIFSSFESLHKLKHLCLPSQLSQLSVDDARLGGLLEAISKKCPHLESIDICPLLKRIRPFPWFRPVLSPQFSNSQLDSLARRLLPQTAVNCYWTTKRYFASRRHPPPQPSLFSRIISKFW